MCVCALVLLVCVCPYGLVFCTGAPQVSETEREDLEESAKVQHWVERLCQTRLEQITHVDGEGQEVNHARVPPQGMVCLGNCIVIEFIQLE